MPEWFTYVRVLEAGIVVLGITFVLMAMREYRMERVYARFRKAMKEQEVFPITQKSTQSEGLGEPLSNATDVLGRTSISLRTCPLCKTEYRNRPDKERLQTQSK